MGQSLLPVTRLKMLIETRLTMMNDKLNSSQVEHVDGHTESLGSILVDCDGPEDLTVRPSRLYVKRFWPKDVPFPPPTEGNGNQSRPTE